MKKGTWIVSILIVVVGGYLYYLDNKIIDDYPVPKLEKKEKEEVIEIENQNNGAEVDLIDESEQVILEEFIRTGNKDYRQLLLDTSDIDTSIEYVGLNKIKDGEIEYYIINYENNIFILEILIDPELNNQVTGQNGGLVKSNNHVFFGSDSNRGNISEVFKVIEDADPKTIEVVNQRHTLSKDENNVFVRKSKVEGINSDELRTVGQYILDNESVFYHFPPGKLNLVEGAEPISFVNLDGEYYGDDESVFIGTEDLNISSSEFSKFDHQYIMNIDGVYLHKSSGSEPFKLEGVDRNTFKNLAFNYYVDKDKLIYGKTIQSNVNVDSLEFLSTTYGHDPGSGGGEGQFEDASYIIDRNNVFVNGLVLGNVDIESFEILKGEDYGNLIGLSRDKNAIYLFENKIEYVDVNTFMWNSDSRQFEDKNGNYNYIDLTPVEL
ncbi:DKNYY domain-containing protein [Candidatus Pacebacteria bacterium]|nr:DKNYY domain-containing protein [Candidatus Paceibacterota bacterium]